MTSHRPLFANDSLANSNRLPSDKYIIPSDKYIIPTNFQVFDETDMCTFVSIFVHG